MRRVAEHQGILTNGRFDVVLIGDSLTDFWSHTGKPAWDTHLAPLRCVNCGIAADRTEHIIWRIRRCDFRRVQPKVFVLLMGTNNLGMDPPDTPGDVVQAILAASRELLARHPASKVLVLTLPPSGLEPNSALRQRIKQADALLEKSRLPARVSVLPLYNVFVDENDRWRDGLTLDGTHFSAAGYDRLAEILVPKLGKLLGKD